MERVEARVGERVGVEGGVCGLFFAAGTSRRRRSQLSATDNQPTRVANPAVFFFFFFGVNV